MAIVVEVARSDRAPTRPGIGAHGPPPIKVLPFTSQIEAWPLLVFWKRRSLACGAPD